MADGVNPWKKRGESFAVIRASRSGVYMYDDRAMAIFLEVRFVCWWKLSIDAGVGSTSSQFTRSTISLNTTSATTDPVEHT